MGSFVRDLEVELEGDSKGDFRGGDFRGGDVKQDMEGDLLSSSGQVRSRSGLVHVWSRSGSVYRPNLVLLSLTLK